MNPLLEVRNLRVHFRTPLGVVQAVRGIDFQLNQNEIVGLVGESGCGKSVTAHSILRLCSSHNCSVSGSLAFDGNDLLLKTEKEMEALRGKEIGMIFQDPMSALNPTLSVGYQVREIVQYHERITKQAAHQRVLELLKWVGIGDPEQRINQYPHELSGGMRQRILIAIALACNPRLLIADEPTTALDVTIQLQILQLLKRIQSERRLSILFITHDLGVVAHLCDRVLVMYAGKIVEEGPCEQIFSRPLHPYTQALLKSKSSLNQQERLYTIPGSPPSLRGISTGCSFAPRCPQVKPLCQKIEPPTIRRSACWLEQEERR